jgi:hypothetical protein
MRKTIINNPAALSSRPYPQRTWLDLEEIATVEVTSEDPNFPIEAALVLQL